MKKILVELLGKGPWQYDSRAGRVMITLIILISLIAWLALAARLLELGKAVLG